MDWYYSEGQERRGPVGEEEFQRLVQQGIISGQTLVWNETMADWKPYTAIGAPPPLRMVSVESSGSPPVTCAGCRASFPADAVVTVAGSPFCAACKPMALQRLQEGVGLSSDAEQVRHQYLKHEASVKSVGSLYLLGGILWTLIGLGTVAMAFSSGELIQGLLVGAFLLALGGVQLWVGLALQKLRPWTRIPTAVLSAIGLLGFPLGTLINGYILYLILGKKGKMVFSPEYAAVIEQTPHIKYRTSVLLWVLLGLVVLAVFLGVGAVVLGKR